MASEAARPTATERVGSGAGLPAGPLVALPGQPDGVPWPTRDWPTGVASNAVTEAVEAGFNAALAETYAVVVVQGGRLLIERYGGTLPHFDRPSEPVTAETRLLSWSMAKSVLHCLLAGPVGDGRLALDQPPPGVPWSVDGAPAPPDDPRRLISLDQMLQMRDGIDFNEDYVDDKVSDTIAMLFGDGAADVVAYAASRPLRHAPGTVFNYSSGTSNLVAAALAHVLGGPHRVEAHARTQLFGPTGMASARLGMDPAGNWIASSYAYATARDWARFGYLHLRDGWWEDRRLLPANWVDHGRRPHSVDPTDGAVYGSHWWVIDDGRGTFRAGGYAGQSVMVCPALDTVVVRLGNTPAEAYPPLAEWRSSVLDALDPAGGGA
jgi:CubicO group peptidase (beta-lactamase class C family)